MKEHRLASIMFTDVVGYTAMIEKDEEQAITIIKKHEEVIAQVTGQFNGKVYNFYGDGSLTIFNSALECVLAAQTIQDLCKHNILVPLRIGLHLGEVTIEGDQIYGVGVNIASRIQSEANEGEVFASEAIYKNVMNQSGIQFSYVGNKELKNVRDKMKIYAVKVIDFPTQYLERKFQPAKGPKKRNIHKWLLMAVIGSILTAAGYLLWQENIMSLFRPGQTLSYGSPNRNIPDKSIAVLPLQDLSNNIDQEYFYAGVTELIQSMLFRIPGLKITSLTTSMMYKNSSLSVKEIGKELNVAFILEGSVRKTPERLNMNVRLIDTKKDQPVWWAEYDRELIDIYAIQSEIAIEIANYFNINIDPDIKHIWEKYPTRNKEVLDKYFRAKIIRWAQPQTAEKLFHDIIELDSTFVPAYTELALTWISRGYYNGYLRPHEVIEHAQPYLDKALELDPDYPNTHSHLGIMKFINEWDFEGALQEFNIAKQLNPSDPGSVPVTMLLMLGRFEEALEVANNGMITDPGIYYQDKGMCHYFLGETETAKEVFEELLENDKIQLLKIGQLGLYLGRYDEVIKRYEDYLTNNKIFPYVMGTLAIAYDHKGQENKSEELIRELLKKSAESPIGSPSFYAARTYAQRNDIESAFSMLEKAFLDHEPEMIWLKVDPLFNPLYGDPSWQELLDKIGFPSNDES